MSCLSTCGRDSNGPIEGLSIDTSLVFYCLAQECLRNIRQHSGASRGGQLTITSKPGSTMVDCHYPPTIFTTTATRKSCLTFPLKY